MRGEKGILMAMLLRRANSHDSMHGHRAGAPCGRPKAAPTAFFTLGILSQVDPITTNAPISLTFEILFSNLKMGVLFPIAVILALFTIDAMGNRIKHIAYHVFAFAFLSGALVWLLFFALSPISGSSTMTYLALAFVMTAVLFTLNFMKLSPLDYAVLFTLFVCVNRFSATWLFGIALKILYIFIVLLAVCKIRFGSLHEHLFHVWFASMLISAEWYICDYLFNYVNNMSRAFDSRLEKLLVWGIATLVIIIANLALIYAVKRLFRKPFDEINQMGKAYPRVERYFIYATAAILLFMALAHCSYILFSGFIGLVSSLEAGNLRIAISGIFNDLIGGLFNLFTLFALIIQLSFLIVLYRMTRLKDNLQNKTLESQSLTAYSTGLEKNMDDIRNIKHDIKNIFLTMSGFVERSGDAEMQTFYSEKISPFANEEIAKSDLYGKLAAINNEQLKAFLFYKISQSVERGIIFDLDISPRFSASDDFIEIIDLVRILGILLDNAIEECMKISHGSIAVKLSQNDELVSYIIKNTVGPETRENGIKPGVSTKGDERGSGLIIVRNILEKYDNATLNSYFAEDSFIQSLVIYS